MDSVTRDHLADENFAIDNTIEDPTLTRLKDKIYEVASKQKHWGESIPARWLTLEKALAERANLGVKVWFVFHF